MKETEAEVRLVDIGELEGATAINRRAARRAVGKSVHLDMSVRLVPEVERNMLSLVVKSSYVYAGEVYRERLMTCSVYANFEVKDLAAHIKRHGENAVVDSQLMMLMLSVAVGALRGVVAVRTKGTLLESRPLPIINISALMYRLHYGEEPQNLF